MLCLEFPATKDLFFMCRQLHSFYYDDKTVMTLSTSRKSPVASYISSKCNFIIQWLVADCFHNNCYQIHDPSQALNLFAQSERSNLILALFDLFHESSRLRLAKIYYSLWRCTKQTRTSYNLFLKVVFITETSCLFLWISCVKFKHLILEV